MLCDGSRVSVGAVCTVPPASSLTRSGTVQVRPLEDFVKKTSVPVVEPPHPEYARYTTPSEPIAMDDWPPWYPGAWSTCTIEPKYGAAGAAAAGVATMPRRARATRANTIGRTKVALDPRELGDRSMVRALLRSHPFALRYLTRVGRFSKMRTSRSMGMLEDGRPSPISSFHMADYARGGACGRRAAGPWRLIGPVPRPPTMNLER